MGGYKQIPKLKAILMPKEQNQYLYDEIQMILAKAINNYKREQRKRNSSLPSKEKTNDNN